MGNCAGKEKNPCDQEEVLLRQLHTQYLKHLLPLEKSCLFSDLCDPPYSLSDVLAPPMVLMMGQYSTGKTSFIKALLGKEYPGMYIAAEPATDNFVAVLRGAQEDAIPGTALVNNLSQPFHSLREAFGDNFLQRFRGAYVSSGAEILDDLVIIDTPGTLDGDGSRTYDYPEAMAWFARRAALIIIFFDVNKMGVAVEMQKVLDSIHGNEEKVKIIFNKSDTVNEKDLTSALSGLKFNLGKAMPADCPEVPCVYVTSLDTLADEYKCKTDTYIDWFRKDKEHLLQDISRVRQNTYTRKVNLLDKRSRMVRNHAFVMMKLAEEKKKCLSLFHRTLSPKDRDGLIERIPVLYQQVQKEEGWPPGEFLPVGSLQGKLKEKPHFFESLPRLKRKKVEKAYRGMEKAVVKLNTKFH